MSGGLSKSFRQALLLAFPLAVIIFGLFRMVVDSQIPPNPGMVEEQCSTPVESFWSRPREMLLIFAGEGYEKRDWGRICFYAAETRKFLANGGKAETVFLGDSLTYNWAQSDPKLFTGGLVNRGVPGQTSQHLLLRFSRDVLALRPKAVHILSGTNDLSGKTGPTSPRDFQDNIRAMVMLAKANGIIVILGAIPPADHSVVNKDLNSINLVRQLNHWLADYAREQQLIYVDYYSPLADANGAPRSEFTDADGVHLKDRAYAVMTPLMQDALAKALSEAKTKAE